MAVSGTKGQQICRRHEILRGPGTAAHFLGLWAAAQGGKWLEDKTGFTLTSVLPAAGKGNRQR